MKMFHWRFAGASASLSLSGTPGKIAIVGPDERSNGKARYPTPPWNQR